MPGASPGEKQAILAQRKYERSLRDGVPVDIRIEVPMADIIIRMKGPDFAWTPAPEPPLGVAPLVGTGSFNPDNGGSRITAWEDYLGRSCDVFSVWLPQGVSTWEEIANPRLDGASYNYKQSVLTSNIDVNVLLVIAVPLVPSVDSNRNGANPQVWVDIKNGAHDADYAAMANVFKTDFTNRGDPTGANASLRLGWEQNGSWYSWSVLGGGSISTADSIQNWRASWNRITNIIKNVLPDVKCELQIAGGANNRRTDLDAYVPTQNVDILSHSTHDGGGNHTMFSSSLPFTDGLGHVCDTFERLQVDPHNLAGRNMYGLQEIVDYVAANQPMKYGTSEWATQFSGDGAFFDTAPEPNAFIQGSYDFFNVNRTHLSHICWFGDSCCSLRSPTAHSSNSLYVPARNLFKSLFENF
jgi:hypothetical protein